MLSHRPGYAGDFRQLEWTETFEIGSADVGILPPLLAPVDTELRFQLDPDDVLNERNEANNAWTVPIRLHPAGGCP